MGEAATVEIHKKNNSKGLNGLKKDMSKDGKVMSKDKSELESEIEKPIVTSDNYIQLTQNQEILEIK